MKKINNRIKALREKAFRIRNDRRGNGLITSIIVTAIILIALVLLNTPIRTWISGVWDSFSTFIDTKLTTLFNS